MSKEGDKIARRYTEWNGWRAVVHHYIIACQFTYYLH